MECFVLIINIFKQVDFFLQLTSVSWHLHHYHNGPWKKKKNGQGQKHSKVFWTFLWLLEKTLVKPSYLFTIARWDLMGSSSHRDAFQSMNGWCFCSSIEDFWNRLFNIHNPQQPSLMHSADRLARAPLARLFSSYALRKEARVELQSQKSINSRIPMKILQLEGRFFTNSAVPVVFKFGKKHVSKRLFSCQLPWKWMEWYNTV